MSGQSCFQGGPLRWRETFYASSLALVQAWAADHRCSEQILRWQTVPALAEVMAGGAWDWVVRGFRADGVHGPAPSQLLCGQRHPACFGPPRRGMDQFPRTLRGREPLAFAQPATEQVEAPDNFEVPVGPRHNLWRAAGPLRSRDRFEVDFISECVVAAHNQRNLRHASESARSWLAAAFVEASVELL